MRVFPIRVCVKLHGLQNEAVKGDNLHLVNVLNQLYTPAREAANMLH